MKDKNEIVAAHDMLVQILLGEFPEDFVSDPMDKTILTVSADVLCWILDHDHTESFSKNLNALRRDIEAKGYVLTRVDCEG